MSVYGFLVVSLLSAAPDFEDRIDVLRRHVERLHTITVAPSDQAEKESKLTVLEKDLQQEIADESNFNNLYRKIDTVRTWLLEHSASKPEPYHGTFKETRDAWELSNDRLSLAVSKADLSIRVTQNSVEWEMAPSDDSDLEFSSGKISLLKAVARRVEKLQTGYSIGFLVDLAGIPNATGVEIILGIQLSDNEVLFEVTAPREETPVQGVNWPKAIRFDTNSAEDYSVIPFMQGALIPANWPHEFGHNGGISQTRWFYMPWWGQVREGASVQTILETCFDGGAYYPHPPGGPTTIHPHWFSSLGKLRYPRRIRYIFEESGSYVGMCKRYRRFVQENGQFVSLNEKLVRNPKVAGVVGKPVIHLGSLYHFVPEAALYNKERIEHNHNLTPIPELARQLRELKARGIEAAYVHLDGWGFRGYDNAHPDVLPAGEEQGGWEGLREFAKTCQELGYLFAVHDNYRDFYKSAVSFNPQLAITRANGRMPEDSTWCGGPQAFLSALFAPGYVRRNHDLFAENGVRLGGAYLDVFAVADLDESFQAAHPMSREDCARFRRSCFDLLRARGYVVSSEEPVDYAVPSLDLVHHGPYPTRPKLGGGEAVGVPVPLFNLVYHDAILLPWDMSEDGGWGIPKGDAGRLHCLLNAGLPYVYPGASEANIKQVNEAASLAERLATKEMVNHEFLDPARRRERTTFSDGTQVTVDLDSKEYSIVPGVE